GITDDDLHLLLELGQAGGVPVVIQGLGGRSKVDVPTAGWAEAESFLNRANEEGVPIYSLLMTRPFDRTVEIGPNNVHYRACFAFHELLNLPEDDRRAALQDPEWRDRVRHAV